MDSLSLTDYPGYVADKEGIISAISLTGDLFPVKYYKVKKGYLACTLNGKMVSVHRLIAKVFLDEFDDKLQVNHINGNKEDNRVINLEMCTNSENMKHAIENGLINNVGSNNGSSKLKESDVRFIKDNILIMSQKRLAQMFGIDPSVISDIKRNKLWRHV